MTARRAAALSDQTLWTFELVLACGLGVFTLTALARNGAEPATLLAVLALHIAFDAGLLTMWRRAERQRRQVTDLGQRLQVAEARRQALADAVPDAVIELDADRGIVFASPAWTRMTGMNPAFSLGRRIDDILVSENGRQALRRADGALKPVEARFWPLPLDASGAPRSVGVIRDLAHADGAPRSEAERRYRDLFERAVDGLFQATPDGRLLYANAALARLLGYDSAEELLATAPNLAERVLLPPPERAALAETIQTVGETVDLQLELRRRDDSTAWVTVSFRTVQEADGTIRAIEGRIQDATRQRAAEARLRDMARRAELTSRAASDFLANMSHELRTPLNAVIGFSEIIKTEMFGPVGQPVYREYAADIHESGGHMLALDNDILDMAKIDAGQRRLAEAPTDVAKLIEASLRVIRPQAAELALQVETDVAANLPLVLAEERALKQVLLNLLSNAVKFTPHGGRVRVSARLRDDGAVEVGVHDTGVGMGEDEIAVALAPFGQVENGFVRGDRPNGTGLGLPLARALAELHGGEFSLTSAPNVGVTATFTLPRCRVLADRAALAG